MADIFDVVADTTRRDILAVLLERETSVPASGGEISVSEIVSTLGLSQPTVSKHLKVLREAGLVGVREEGQHRYYHLDRGPLEVHEDNPRARRFYEKLGFTLTGRSREYELAPGGLELEMIKPLR